MLLLELVVLVVLEVCKRMVQVVLIVSLYPLHILQEVVVLELVLRFLQLLYPEVLVEVQILKIWQGVLQQQFLLD